MILMNMFFISGIFSSIQTDLMITAVKSTASLATNIVSYPHPHLLTKYQTDILFQSPSLVQLMPTALKQELARTKNVPGQLAGANVERI